MPTNLKFDYILTNPPFSIKLDSKKTDDGKILKGYDISKTLSNKDPSLSFIDRYSGKTSSEGSNVLFLERYKNLLKENAGELLTIIDDTVLNGAKSQKYRDFILEYFIIIQVVSLPFNTFFRADANIKTSMLHLRRKKKGEQQGNIFMAITNNIGHDDHQKDTPARDNLPIVSDYYFKWKKEGRFEPVIIHNEHPDEPLGCPLQIFEVEFKELNKKRLDAFYYSPELNDLRLKLHLQEKTGKIELKNLRSH